MDGGGPILEVQTSFIDAHRIQGLTMARGNDIGWRGSRMFDILAQVQICGPSASPDIVLVALVERDMDSIFEVYVR